MALARASTLFAALTLSACTQVPKARFGLITGLAVTETRHIRYVVGTHYGFRIDYHDIGRVMKLREQFELPGPANFRSKSPPEQFMLASHDRRTWIREVQMGSHTPSPPEIHSFFIEDIKIARGDPKGKYTVRLWLDDRPFKDFEFYIE